MNNGQCISEGAAAHPPLVVGQAGNSPRRGTCERGRAWFSSQGVPRGRLLSTTPVDFGPLVPRGIATEVSSGRGAVLQDGSTPIAGERGVASDGDSQREPDIARTPSALRLSPPQPDRRCGSHDLKRVERLGGRGRSLAGCMCHNGVAVGHSECPVPGEHVCKECHPGYTLNRARPPPRCPRRPDGACRQSSTWLGARRVGSWPCVEAIYTGRTRER